MIICNDCFKLTSGYFWIRQALLYVQCEICDEVKLICIEIENLTDDERKLIDIHEKLNKGN